MKQGKINTYINEQLANLLNEHGPKEGHSDRFLADKLNYIIKGWDAILRDEKRRWRDILRKEEWFVLQACTISHSFAMEDGGIFERDFGAVLACVSDTLDSEIAMDDAARWRASTIDKIKGAAKAQDMALVWMLIRSRR